MPVYIYNLSEKSAYAKPEDNGNSIRIPPNSVYIRRVDGVANNKSGVIKMPEYTSVIINPSGNIHFLNDFIYKIHALRNADRGYKDLNWLKNRQNNKDFGWDSLFNRIK